MKNLREAIRSVLNEENKQDVNALLKKGRQDLTEVSRFIAMIDHPEAKKAEKLIDQARKILFDAEK